MNLIAEMEKRAGRLVLAGFEGKTLPSELSRLLEGDSLLGVILFKRNVESPAQVAALNASVRGASPPLRAPVIGVDQEGGRVVRMREPLTALPTARAFGRLGDPAITALAGELSGRELAALGFTLNFAPVLDVDTNPASPVIGDRSYGEEPETVIRHGLAFAEGLRQGGVLPCAKHFPGHGDATVDSHKALPAVAHDRERLSAVEIAPFRAWIEARLGPIMTAHVVYPALDTEAPATLSRRIVSGLLRETLGFDGPVLTDDLEMGAMAAFGGPGGAAVRAVRAGADGLLVCRGFSHVEAVIGALAKEAVDTPAFRQRLDDAGERLSALRRTGQGDTSYLGSQAHRTSVQRVLSVFEGETA